MEHAVNYSVWIWVVLCIFFLILEVVAVAGIGFLYAGLAALTVGFLVAFNLLDAKEIMLQVAVFLFLSGMWAALLWIPMKRMLQRKGGGYLNFIGQYAIVTGEELTLNDGGTVKWSGTSMRARIDLTLETSTSFAVGASVVITKVDGNTLFVVSPSTFHAAAQQETT